MRSHLAKFATGEKELRRNLEPGEVVHNFNPSTGKVEADGSLSLSTAWSTEQIPEQPSSGSEGNH